MCAITLVCLLVLVYSSALLLSLVSSFPKHINFKTPRVTVVIRVEEVKEMIFEMIPVDSTNASTVPVSLHMLPAVRLSLVGWQNGRICHSVRSII